MSCSTVWKSQSSELTANTRENPRQTSSHAPTSRKSAEDHREADVRKLIRQERPRDTEQIGAQTLRHRRHRNGDDSSRGAGKKCSEKRGGEQQIIDA